MAERTHLGPGDGPEVHIRPPARLPVDTDILAPINLMRDGGFDDESEDTEPLVINIPVNPNKPVFNLAFVSAVGNNEAEVTVRNIFGKEVTKTMKSQELFDLERKKYGGMKMTEVAAKREGTFGNKATTFIERIWKTTFTRQLHEVKEARVGGKLMVAAGVDTAITAEFDAVIDQKARERIGEQRNNWFKRLTGNIRDVSNEMIGREKDLHREKIKITTELRNEYLQDPSDSKHPYAELLNRDMVAREAVAEKFANTPVDFLGEHGDKAREVTLAPDSPVTKFLQEKIFKKVIADAITQSEAGTYDGKNGGISAELRPKLDQELKDYFFTDEFTTWRNGLSPEEKKVFENSLTYTNNVLAQAETVLMPMVHDQLTYFKTNQDIDFDIKLKIGTGQFGPNNEIVGTSIFSKDRISKNASVYEKLRQAISGDQSKLYTQGDVDKGLKQEMMLAALNSVVSSEVAAAAAGVLIGGTAKKLLHSSVSWIPILGSGLVAGSVSGAKEYANLGKMRERFGEQVAEGYTHPVGVNAVRAEALRKVDYHRVDLGLRSEQLQHVSKQLIEGDKSEETILQTLGYLADSKARVALSDKRHINLFHASTNTPTGRGVYQKQEALHTQARILATTKLHEILSGDEALRTQIANKIGFIPTLTSEQILDGLTAFQGEFLERGTTVDVNIQSALKAVTTAEVKSIVGQDKAFQKWRWKEVGKRAGTTAVLAGTMTLGLSQFSDLHEQTITTNVDHETVTLIDQSVTSHASPLSIAEVQDPNTHEILATMSAHIPKGTTLMADMKAPGAYDLVLSSDPHRVLVDNMTFTDEGHLNMTTAIRESLAHSNIDYHSVSTGEIEIGSPDSSFLGTETLKFGDLPGAHEGGFDQWFANTLNHSYRVTPEAQVEGVDQMVVERTTQINGLREMLYAWEDHEKFVGNTDNFRLIEEPGYNQVMHVDDVTGRYLSEPQANGFYMDNVPKILATEEGHRKIADFINESVRLKLSGGEMSQAQEIAYTMSYDGTAGSIPTPEEFEVLMKALGETSTETAAKTVATHDAWFTMSDDLVEIKTVTTTDVINHTIPTWVHGLGSVVGYSVPLEAPLGRSLRHDDGPESSPYGPYGRRSRVEDEYRSYYPGKEPDWGLYHSRRSPRLNANPDAKLNLKQESDWYFGKVESAYKSRIQTLAAQTEPMNDNVKAVVCMPVAAHQEESNIYNTLTRYTNQVDKGGVKLDPSTFEIFIYLNHPENKTPDGTEREIQRFKHDFPNMPIRIIKETLKPEDVLWGKIVGAMNDTILYRSNQRTNPTNPDYVMLTNDADMTAIAPTYIDNFVNELAKPENAHVDGLLGKLEWSTEAYDKYPVFHAATRFWQYVDNITRHGTVEGDGIKRPNIGSPGATFGIRASTYAGIGGYLQETGAGADQELSWMIKAARGADNSKDLYEDNYPIKMLNTAWLESSPRRGLDYYLQGKPIVNQWADWDQRAKNSDPAREKKFVDILGAGESLSNFSTERLESEVNALLRLYGYDAETPVVKRALGLLGVDFVKDPANGKVKLTNIDKLLTGLKEYKDNNRSQVKKATNQAPRNP